MPASYHIFLQYPSNSYHGPAPLTTRKPTAQTRAGYKCDLVHFYYKDSRREDDIWLLNRGRSFQKLCDPERICVYTLCIIGQYRGVNNGRDRLPLTRYLHHPSSSPDQVPVTYPKSLP
jgi:hypothetical protein